MTTTATLILRIGVFGTFLGHGLVALQGNPAWIPYLTTVGFFRRNCAGADARYRRPGAGRRHACLVQTHSFGIVVRRALGICHCSGTAVRRAACAGTGICGAGRELGRAAGATLCSWVGHAIGGIGCDNSCHFALWKDWTK